MSHAALLRLKNILIYGAVACLNMAATVLVYQIGVGAVPAFEGDGLLAPGKGVATATLAVLVPALTGWLAANRSRVGSERLDAQADVLEKRGTPRSQVKVEPLPPGHEDRPFVEHEQCGHPGLLALIPPSRERELLDVLHARRLDGRRFPPGEQPTCGNCGLEVAFVFARRGADGAYRWLARSAAPTGGRAA